MIVATGSFKNFSRDNINRFIESLGAFAKGAVSKKTDFIVAGENAGSKPEVSWKKQELLTYQ